ncbi:MAG: SNF2-related protein [Flavobacteriales bacterium]
MSINHVRLKDYIYRNTDGNIRSRANSIVVKDYTFSDSGDTVKATVKGSKLYEVHFYGLESGMISSSCTCPYDWGAVCKHEVAAAREIDLYISNGSPKPTTAKVLKNNTNGVYSFSVKDVKDYNKKEFLKHSASHIFSQGNEDYVDRAYVKNDTLHLDIRGDYWQNGSTKLTKVNFVDNTVQLRSNCICKKERLCKHLSSALLYIHHHLDYLLQSNEDKENSKEKLLNDYGFSLKNDRYKTYFKFEESFLGLRLIHLQEGIIKKFEHSDISYFADDLASEENKFGNKLPFVHRQDKTAKNRGIAFAFRFYSIEDEMEEASSIYANVITGNLNKDRTRLSTKIDRLEIDDYLLEKSTYSQKEQNLIEEAYVLEETHVDHLISTTVNLKNYVHSKLKSLVPKLKGQIVYKWDYSYFNVSKKDLTPINLHSESADLEFTVNEETDFFTVEVNIIINGRRQTLKNARIGKNYFFIKQENDYYLNKNIYLCKTIQFFKNQPIIRVPKEDFETFKHKILDPLEDQYQIDYKSKPKTPKSKQRQADSIKKQVFLSEYEDFILLKPVVEYDKKPVSIFSKKEVKLDDNKVLIRDLNIEKELENEIRNAHPNFEHQQDDFFYLTQDEFVDNTWFLDALEALEAKTIDVFGFKDLKTSYNQHKPSISINVSSDIDWFDVQIEVAFGEQVLSLKDLKKNIIAKDQYIQLKDSTIGILPQEWMEKYTHLFRSGEVKKDRIGVSKYQFSVIDTLYEELENENNLFDDHLEIKKKLRNFETVAEVAKPRGLKATLRDYQKEGLKWLNFLDDFNLGGCLADDMGLGKTLQIISFIKHLKTKRKEKIPHLIIVPTSLIFNWQEEVNKFCPSLKIKVLTGINRTKNSSDFEKFDIILSTYGIVMNDIDYLKEYVFNYIILDESQAIKNPVSKRFKSVRLLKAKNRLVLTGTPIENNTFDLYAQMTFVNPGLLGGMQQFKNQYSNAIDKNKDKDAAAELKTLIDPFLLRRTKEQVATELPPKTEQFLYCTMKDEQRKVYEAYKNKYKNYLLGKIEDDGLGKSKMYVLEGLTKLRQICDSPSLLNDEDSYTDQSIKIDELVRHITEKTNQHKILIFSQFVKMLGLIKNRLNDLNINYEYLDGRTKNRQQKVDNFQTNDDVRVFLISLKAGGTGLNLTAADYVYVVDPWWNPAVEAQAIDRCYRIGQKKNVTAFKMICKDTIEEKIVTHQQSKKQLSDDLIQTEDSFVKSLTKESVAALFD